MNLVTHLSFGLLITLIIYATLNPNIDTHTLNLYLMAAAVGTLLPDIDHPKAYVSKTHWMLHGASHLMEVLSHHRGITHSLLMLLASSSILAAVLNHLNQNIYLTLPYALGYLSHLTADTLNPMGVKWLQPLSQKTLKLDKKIWFIHIRINTGSITERLLGTTLGLTFLYLYGKLFLF